MQTITVFDTSKHHIYLSGKLYFKNGLSRSFKGILDTGASKTEISTHFLIASKVLSEEQLQKMVSQHHQETQKIGKILLPQLDICGQTLNDIEIFVSHFSPHWNMDALIGLDFFRRFQVTVDYSRGELRTKIYQS